MSDTKECRSAEVIAKELLVAYLGKSSPVIDFAHAKDKCEEVGICIGKAYRALLAEIKK